MGRLTPGQEGLLWCVVGIIIIAACVFGAMKFHESKARIALNQALSSKKTAAENLKENDEQAWAAMFENNIKSFPPYTIFVLKTGEVAIFEGMTGICVRYSQMHGYNEVELGKFSKIIKPKEYFFPDVPMQEKQRAYLVERFIRNERVPENWEEAVK